MRPSASRLLLAWVPAIAWAVLIFALSAQPNLRVAQDDVLDLVLRKAAHMVAFGVLALLLWRALAATTRLRSPWAWAAVMAIAYAVADELHQSIVPGRHAALTDVGIDAIGVAIALGISLALVRVVAPRRLRHHTG